MIKLLWLIVFAQIFMIASCVTARRDPAFNDITKEFEDTYHVSARHVSIDFSDKFDDADTIAECSIGLTFNIKVRKWSWFFSDQLTRKIILYHELGHCIFLRPHTNDLYPEDHCPKSIMYYRYENNTISCFLKHQSDLIKELPGR